MIHFEANSKLWTLSERAAHEEHAAPSTQQYIVHCVHNICQKQKQIKQ